MLARRCSTDIDSAIIRGSARGQTMSRTHHKEHKMEQGTQERLAEENVRSICRKYDATAVRSVVYLCVLRALCVRLLIPNLSAQHGEAISSAVLIKQFSHTCDIRIRSLH